MSHHGCKCAHPVDPNATKFSNIRSLPYVETRHINTRRTMEVYLTFQGKDLASRISHIRNNKVVSTDYHFNSMQDYEAYMKLPVG